MIGVFDPRRARHRPPVRSCPRGRDHPAASSGCGRAAGGGFAPHRCTRELRFPRAARGGGRPPGRGQIHRRARRRIRPGGAQPLVARSAADPDITHAAREPRRAIEVEVAAPAGSFKLIATHFGLSLKERRAQARALVAIARRHPRTTVMLGDFNEWFWPASLRGALGRELPARAPSMRPSRHGIRFCGSTASSAGRRTRCGEASSTA